MHILRKCVCQLGCLAVPVCRGLRRPTDDQRGTGLVDQDAVHFIDDAEMEAALHQLIGPDGQVVPQVIKPDLAVGHVGDVHVVGLLAGVRVHGGLDQSNSQPQKAVDLGVQFHITAGQVVVHSDHVHPLALQGVQIGGHDGHQGLALPRAHLRHLPIVQDHATDQLHVVGPQPQDPERRLTHDCKGLHEKVVDGLALGQAVLELLRLGCQLLIGEGLHLRLELVDGIHTALVFLPCVFGGIAESTKDIIKAEHCTEAGLGIPLSHRLGQHTAGGLAVWQ
mmetsp:Transcript_79493/g.133143  ORF Transcript_79493/g.133143 Transcript_79493/m.133143 type:complete len:279 (-) Transcript_79493:296-1132(-)